MDASEQLLYNGMFEVPWGTTETSMLMDSTAGEGVDDFTLAGAEIVFTGLEFHKPDGAPSASGELHFEALQKN